MNRSWVWAGIGWGLARYSSVTGPIHLRHTSDFYLELYRRCIGLISNEFRRRPELGPGLAPFTCQ